MAKRLMIEVPIIGRDQTKQAVTSAQRNIGGLTRTIQSYYGEILAVTGAVYGLVRATSSLVDAYKQQQVAESKLITTFISTGRYTVEAINQAQELASEWQALAGVSDDMIINAQAILATFTKISTNTFPEAIEAALNMSKTFGQDLQQSIIQLGTALNDPIMGVGRLRRIGISFSEEQKTLIKQFMEQNDLMSAQRVILDELETELGGVARAYGQTVAGQMDIVNEQFNDLKECLGEMLVEGGVLQGFLLMATGIVNKLNEWGEALGIIKRKSEDFMSWSRDQIKQQIEANNERLDQIAKEIREQEKIIKSTGRLSRAHREAKKRLEELNEEWKKLVTENYRLQQALDKTTQRERKAEQQRKKLTQTTKKGLETLSQEQIAQINAAKRWEIVSTKLTKMNAAETLWARDKTAKQKADELTESLKDQATAYKHLSLAIDQYYKQNQQDLIWSQEKVKESVIELTDAYSVYYDQIRRINAQNIDYQTEVEKVLEEHEELEAQIEDMAQVASEYWGDFWYQLGEQAQDTIDIIEGALKRLYADIMKTIGKMLVLKGVESLFQGNFLKAGLAFAGSAAFYASAGTVQRLQSGGIVTQPTLALIGEREPEAVIPLSKAKMGITVNVYGSVMTEKDLTQTIIREAKRQGFV